MLTARNTQRRFRKYSAGNDNQIVFAAIDRAIAAAEAKLPVAGDERIELKRDALQGAWSLRFGRFGCPDSETRGGVVQLADGALVGGDQHFAYRGTWRIDGSALIGSIDVLRHGEAADLLNIYGSDESQYSAECVAEAITPDRFEGRLRRPGHPDVRILMRRLTFG